MMEADQLLLALHQLANNNNSANFHNNIKKSFKLPKWLTTTMPTFDRKSEKFELFEDFFLMSLKIHIQLTEDDRINYFQSLMREDELQTFKNNNGPTRENLGEILAVFRRIYVKPQTTQNSGQEVYHDSCLKRPSLWLRRKVSLRFKVYRKNQKVREIQDYQDFKAKIDGKIFLYPQKQV